MSDAPLPRRLIRQLGNPEIFPLVTLQAIRDTRHYLDDLEKAAITKAIELGAGVQDIADHLGITRQGAYYKLKLIADQEATPDEHTDPPERA